MSVDPPDGDDPLEEESASESPNQIAGGRSSDGVRKARPYVATFGVLAVVGGVALFLFMSRGSGSETRQQPPPMRGLSCPYLQQAADAQEQGDREAFDQAINKAGQAAQDALQNSGQIFGQPERIALQLQLGGSNHAGDLLSRALVACSKPSDTSASA